MNSDTPLLRQVHPNWVQESRATSQTFTPTPKDKGKLSAYDGDQITAEASWSHFTGQLGYASAGVLAVTLAECQSQDIPVDPDPALYREHVLIDLSGFSRSQARDKGKHLARYANDRGWLYRP